LAAAAAVLTGQGHEDKTYTLVSDTAWSFDELARLISTASGKNVVLQAVSFDEQKNILLITVLPEHVAMLNRSSDADRFPNAATRNGKTNFKRLNLVEVSHMQVEIWSDFVCPFCYIGKRKFEAALEQFPNKNEVKVYLSQL
jgi:hypothetical protein